MHHKDTFRYQKRLNKINKEENRQEYYGNKQKRQQNQKKIHQRK